MKKYLTGLFLAAAVCAAPEAFADTRWYGEEAYLRCNPDVAIALRRGQITSAYDHFLQFGRYENRITNGRCNGNGDSRPPRWFNEREYLRCNPDVRQAVRRGQMPSGWYHYQTFGRRENRQLNCR